METTQPTADGNEMDSIASYHDDIRQVELEGYQAGIKKARNALYWAAGLIFAGEMIAMYTSGGGFNWLVLVIALIEAGIFVALALWTKKKPYTAIICGLVAFIGILLLSAVVNAYVDGGAGFLKALFGGIIVKVLILVNLIRPLKDAKTLQDMMNEKALIPA